MRENNINFARKQLEWMIKLCYNKMVANERIKLEWNIGFFWVPRAAFALVTQERFDIKLYDLMHVF